MKRRGRKRRTDELHRRIIRRAIRKYHRVFPCLGKTSLEECFTQQEGKVFFWFNTEDCDTHVIVADSSAALTTPSPPRRPGA